VLGAVQILTMAAGLARTKVLAVLLGPSGLGITGVIDQIVAFLAHLGSMSIPFAALRYLSKYRTEGGDAFASLYVAFRRALWISSTVALLGGIAFVTLRFGNPSNDLAAYRSAVLLGLLSIPAIAFIALDRNVLAVFDRSRMAGVMALLVAIALVGSTYIGLRVGGLRGLYAGNLLVYGVLAILLSVLVRRDLPAGYREIPGKRSVTQVLRSEPGLVKFCTSVHLLTLASPAAYLIARVVLLDKWGAVETGLMAAAFGVGVAVRTAMSQANALYLTPLTNRATPQSDRAAAVSHYARTLTILFLLGVLPIVLFPDLFLSLLFSRRFVSASGTVGIFMIAEGLLLMAGVYQSLLIGFDDLNGYTLLVVVANMATIASSLVLIPAFGIIGCAFAFVCGNGILLILTLLRLATFHSLTGVVRETGVFWSGMLSLAVLTWWVSDQSRSQIFFRITVGLFAYAALIPMLSFAEIRGILTARMRGRPRETTANGPE
jgi:antigen flippase